VNGLAGVPILASWLKASSSLLVIMPTCSELSFESYAEARLFSHQERTFQKISYIGSAALFCMSVQITSKLMTDYSQQYGTFEESPRGKVCTLLLDSQVTISCERLNKKF
jgi:hypothetical protein